jgi:hypothetical protein
VLWLAGYNTLASVAAVLTKPPRSSSCCWPPFGSKEPARRA